MAHGGVYHIAVGIGIGMAIASTHWGTSSRVAAPDARIAADSVVRVHLAVFEVTASGERVESSPVQRALMEFDCRANRYRRLGADVERPDGVVEILDGQQGGYNWRLAQINDPEFMQIRASCGAH